MNMKGGLGRGLDHLFSNVQEIKNDEDVSKIKVISINQLKAGIYQPRKKFSEDSLIELSTSIKNQGIIQPLLVRTVKNSDGELYEIIAGERRFRAAKLAQITEIPVIINNYSDSEAMTIALIENLQREDLNAIEEAEAFYNLKEMLNLSQEELAEKLGKSRSGIANSLRLLSLPSYITENITSDKLSASHGRCLLAVNNENDQKILFDAVISKELSVREVEKAVEVWKLTGKLPTYIYANPTEVLKKSADTEKYVNPIMEAIETRLKDKFYKKASIRGDERKGSIKINYKNTEELQYIIDTLSIEYKL